MQTITQLTLSVNSIGDEGAKELAGALQNNQVIDSVPLSLHLSLIYLFAFSHADYHTTHSLSEQHRSCRCERTGWCSSKQSGD